MKVDSDRQTLILAGDALVAGEARADFEARPSGSLVATQARMLSAEVISLSAGARTAFQACAEYMDCPAYAAYPSPRSFAANAVQAYANTRDLAEREPLVDIYA